MPILTLSSSKTSRPSARLRALILLLLSRRAAGLLQFKADDGRFTLRTLLALLYLCDTEIYRQSGSSLSHTSYRTMAEGPVPDGFYRILRRLLRERRIHLIPGLPAPQRVDVADLDSQIVLRAPQTHHPDNPQTCS